MACLLDWKKTLLPSFGNQDCNVSWRKLYQNKWIGNLCLKRICDFVLMNDFKIYGWNCKTSVGFVLCGCVLDCSKRRSRRFLTSCLPFTTIERKRFSRNKEKTCVWMPFITTSWNFVELLHFMIHSKMYLGPSRPCFNFETHLYVDCHRVCDNVDDIFGWDLQ